MAEKWEIIWHMRGPIGSTVGATCVTRGCSLPEARTILVRYRNPLAKDGYVPKIQPMCRWLLEHAFDTYMHEFQPTGYTLEGIEIKERSL